jgi:hypothetical protein
MIADYRAGVSMRQQANEAQRNRGGCRADRLMPQRLRPFSQRGLVELATSRRGRSSHTGIDACVYFLLDLRKERLHDRVVVLRAEFTMCLGGGANLLRRQVRRAHGT